MGQPGRKSKLYVNAGTHASPSWTLIDRAQDVTVPLSKERVEQDDRSSPFKKKHGGGKEFQLNFGYTYKKGTDAVYSILLDSFLNDTAIELLELDDLVSVTGAKGWRGYMEVFGFEKGQELNNTVSIDVECELTEHEEGGSVVEPDHYQVP